LSQAGTQAAYRSRIRDSSAPRHIFASTTENLAVTRHVRLTPGADAVLTSVIDAYNRSTGLRLTKE